jgi:1-acyl-sn-glycerol-3-phosphate acyltransferase
MVPDPPALPAQVPEAADPEMVVDVLRIVRSLAQELHPHLRGTGEASLDSHLERDLGFDSLGRVELVLRLGTAFGVRLPESVLGDAETPRDLLAALLAAGPQRAHPSGEAAAGMEGLSAVEAPARAQTLVEVLEYHARAHPGRPHVRVLLKDEEEDPLSYGELRGAACEIAFGLIDAGLAPGDRVGIMLGTGLDFFRSFIGVLYAGGVPVPIYPPARRSQVEEHLRRQAGILRNAQAGFLIVADELREVAPLLLGLAGDLRHVRTVGTLRGLGAVEAPMPAGAQDAGLIQYTSGSTGDPKGVVLSHANLLANVRAMGTALEVGPEDVFVSWLPLYHDMGLIGAWLGPFYYGVPTMIMSPLAFLADPARWLRTMSRHRATLSAAPNFAFELCCKSIRDEDLAGIDLSSVRMVANGAEPVSPGTIRRFSERFAAYGFRAEAMAPVYGLAENAVGLAFPPLGRVPVVDRIERVAISRDRLAVPAAAGDATALSFVACGRPLPLHQIRIVDEAGLELPERREGRLQFKGPSSTSGYFRNPEKNRTLFDGAWVESHDRAYIADGDVFITGRIKDMIIKGGRNLYPQEIEALVGEIEGVHRGGVAAFAGSNEQAGTEGLVLLVETRLRDTAKREELSRRVSAACSRMLDMVPDVIELVAPNTVPKTSSGKIRRAAARALYEAGLPGPGRRGMRMQVLMLALSGLRGRAWQAWRRAREVAFAAWFWGVLGAVMAVAGPAVMLLPRRRWRHGMVHRAARLFLRLAGIRLRVTFDAGPPPDAAILVANHASYLDALVLIAALPGELTFVAKKELAGQVVAGAVLRRLGTLFVERSAVRESVADTGVLLAAVQAGERLVVFAEGTLTRMPGLLGFHLGPFAVAARSSRPVVPVTIRGTRAVLRGEQWFARAGSVTVDVGAPVMPEGDDFSASVRLRDRVRGAILARCGEPDLLHERVVVEAARR